MNVIQQRRFLEQGHEHTLGTLKCLACIRDSRKVLSCLCGGGIHRVKVADYAIGGRPITLLDVLCDSCGDAWARSEAGVEHFKKQCEEG